MSKQCSPKVKQTKLSNLQAIDTPPLQCSSAGQAVFASAVLEGRLPKSHCCLIVIVQVLVRLLAVARSQSAPGSISRLITHQPAPTGSAGMGCSIRLLLFLTHLAAGLRFWRIWRQQLRRSWQEAVPCDSRAPVCSWPWRRLGPCLSHQGQPEGCLPQRCKAGTQSMRAAGIRDEAWGDDAQGGLCSGQQEKALSTPAWG